jgi:hypothetical protein
VSSPVHCMQMSQANHQKALEDMRAANEREMKSLSVLMADKLQAAEDAGRQVECFSIFSVLSPWLSLPSLIV